MVVVGSSPIPTEATTVSITVGLGCQPFDPVLRASTAYSICGFVSKGSPRLEGSIRLQD